VADRGENRNRDRPSIARRLVLWWRGIGATNQIAIVIPLSAAIVGVLVAVPLNSDPNTLGPIRIEKRAAGISIDGLSVRDGPKGGQVVDLQIRNSGDRVAYVHNVQFHILASSEEPFCLHPYAVKSSYSYDLRFPDPSQALSQTVARRIDQAVPADDVDRFRIALGFPEGGLNAGLYQASVAVTFNDDRGSSRRLVVLRLDGFKKALAASVNGSEPSYQRCLEKAVQNVLSITSLPGQRSNSVDQLRRNTLRLQWELAQG
jgi:hypothetical protein